jgi:hypothetical protein
MKKLISIIIVAVALSGCAGVVQKIDRLVRPPKFDNAEYATLVDIRQLAEKKEMCEVPQDQISLALALQNKIDWATKYTQYIPRNGEAAQMFVLLKDEADRFVEHAQKKANPTYCKLKLENMLEQAVIIQKAVGDK